MKRLNNQIALVSLCLMSLSACGVSEPPRKVVVKTETVYRTPPKAYSIECAVPPFIGSKWEDLAADNDRLISVIESCDLRFEKIRNWRRTITESNSQQ